ncbi:MAG: signal peptide peptidase SppA [Hyphomicrobiaceae bacterium]
MSLETEAVLDRRRLRRTLSFWRIAAVAAGALALLAVGLASTSGGPGSSHFGERKQIARITLEGVITENRDQIRLLQRVADAKHVDAVILFINSPGGTTTGGEALFEAIRKVSEKKPVVAQFGTIATSAAYICGLASDHIVARGNTITGSVGVIFQWAEVSELLAKIGVKMNEIKSGPLKANPSPFQPLDEAGRQNTEKMVAESMSWFRGLVAARRRIDTAAVPGLEQGRVFSGREALQLKLIDQLGGETEVHRWLEDTRGITKGLKIVDWKPKKESEWGVLGMLGQGLAGLFGLDPAAARFFTDDPRVSSLLLDGLVSVWQPAEK